MKKNKAKLDCQKCREDLAGTYICYGVLIGVVAMVVVLCLIELCKGV